MEQMMISLQIGTGALQAQILDADSCAVGDDGSLRVLRSGFVVAAYAPGVWVFAAPHSQPLTGESP